jgi:hypothetical protein
LHFHRQQRLWSNTNTHTTHTQTEEEYSGKYGRMNVPTTKQQKRTKKE